MASINFLYRSKKDNAPLTVRLLFRNGLIDHVYSAKSRVIVSKEYWQKKHFLKRVKDVDIINEQAKLNNELNNIESFLLKEFNKADINIIDSIWLRKNLENYYAKNDTLVNSTDYLSSYFEKFLLKKKRELKASTIVKYNAIKSLVDRYEQYSSKKILIEDINLKFKEDFSNYCEKIEQYEPNTTSKALVVIKTVCSDAQLNGHELSKQFKAIKPKYKKATFIYLSFDEIKKIEKIETVKLNESQLNSRDWLIISCYCGQRFSDFMNFKSEDIRIEEGIHLIEFVQKKTSKIMTLPLHEKILNILKKRAGKFPKAISQQKYNQHIKDICQIAEIDQIVSGSKIEETFEGSGIYRKKEGKYYKYELVTSHIGRRSLASNFYGKIPTNYLCYMTGHSTETMFLRYIGKSNKDLAIELKKYF